MHDTLHASGLERLQVLDDVVDPGRGRLEDIDDTRGCCGRRAGAAARERPL